jgi:hypothetical protein
LFSVDELTAERIRPDFEKLHAIDELKPFKNEFDEIIGHRFCFNGPFTQAAIPRLEGLRKKYRGTLHRFDIAYDFAAEMFDYLVRHAVLLWRTPGAMRDFSKTDGDKADGCAWVSIADGKQYPSRNLVLYRRPSKLRDSDDLVAHLELRFLNAGACRRQGVKTLDDLLTVNPRTLLRWNVSWAEPASLGRFIRRRGRNARACVGTVVPSCTVPRSVHQTRKR